MRGTDMRGLHLPVNAGAWTRYATPVLVAALVALNVFVMGAAIYVDVAAVVAVAASTGVAVAVVTYRYSVPLPLRKGVINIGYVLLGFAIGMAIILAAILIGGVLSGTMDTVYNQVGINESSTWYNIKTTAENYIQTGFNVALVAIPITAIGVLLGAILGFAKFGKRGT